MTGAARAHRLEILGGHLLRYGLVGILLYLGTFKFTAVEAQAIQPLVGHRPLMAWLYAVLSVQGVSSLIGVPELDIAALIALRPVAPLVSAWGRLGAVGMFLTTPSFLVTTPDVWQRAPGSPLPVPTGPSARELGTADLEALRDLAALAEAGLRAADQRAETDAVTADP